MLSVQLAVKKRRKAVRGPIPTERALAPVAAQPKAEAPPQSDDLNDAQSAEVLKKMMYLSCAFFASEVLTGPIEAPYNGDFLIGEHHERWSELIMKHDSMCIVASRDHGKTFFFNLAYPIWQAWRHPKSKGYIFSATQEQAERILNDIKEELETNPKLQHLVPPSKSRKKWGARAIRLTNGSLLVAKGYGVKVRGAHPQWIVLDDVLNDEDAYSETVRRRHIEYFHSALVNLVNPNDDPTRGQIIIIGTPYHMVDLYGDLKKNEEFLYEVYPAIDKNGKVLWPERWNAKKLAKRRRQIGAIRFAREFLCKPQSDESSLFPLKLFRGVECEMFTIKLGMSSKFWRERGIETIAMGVDFALSSSTEADWTVLFVIGVDSMGNHWIIDIIRTQGLGYEEQLSLIHKYAKIYTCDMVFLESNQMQRIWGDELIRTTDLPIRKVNTGAEKHSLEKGIPSLRVLLENKKVKIPRGDQESIEKTDSWIEEMFNHTFTDGEVVCIGEHNDQAMAFYVCEQAIRMGIFGFSFEEKEGDEEAYDEMMADISDEPGDIGGIGDVGDDKEPFPFLPGGRPEGVGSRSNLDFLDTGESKQPKPATMPWTPMAFVPYMH